MKKGFYILIGIVIAILTMSHFAYSQAYKIIRLTNNSYNDEKPQINEDGYVVWYGGWPLPDEIFLYDGINVRQLTNNSHQPGHREPHINNNGYVVWCGGDIPMGSEGDEIFLYDGTNIIQLTDNHHWDLLPQISDNGYVVWYDASWDILLYDGTSTRNITDGYYHGINPIINNNGHIVWGEGTCGGNSGEICFYDGSNIIQITDNDYTDFSPGDINDNDYFVWVGWAADGQYGQGYEIFLYDGINTKRLTSNNYVDHEPELNNNGYVVWSGFDGHDYEIFLYDGISVKQITNNDFNDGDPDINDNGFIVWWGQVYEGYNIPNKSKFEIFLYDGTNIKKISDNDFFGNARPKINNSGYIVWEAEEFETGPYEIFLAIPTPTTTAYPKGGVYSTSQSVTLTCNEVPGPGCDKIYYTTDGSTPTISSSIYSSPISITATTALKFFAVDLLGNQETVKTEIYTIDPSAVTLLVPNGGDVLPSGGTYAICWQAPSNAVNFDLLYTTNGTDWIPIKSVTGLNCTHWEEIPVVTVNKKQCRVKVIGYDSNSVKVGEDISDNPFTIEVARVTSPNGRETLTSGNTWAIKWVTNKTERPVAKTLLKYTINGGTTWKAIKTLTGNLGGYNWTVPSVLSTKTKCKVKVVLKDASGVNIGTDVSDKVFTIQP